MTRRPERLGLSIGRAALVLALGNVGSRLLGLVREQVIAALFGASAATDAFTAASRIPTSLYDLLIGGLISAALIPVFSGYVGRDEEERLWQVASAVLNTIMAAVVVSVALLVVAAPWVVDVYATGFSPGTKEQAVELVRYMLPSLAFMAVTGVLTALHYARRRFILPAVALSLYNLGIILAAVVFHSSLAIGSLVAGVLLGALLQATALWWGLGDLRYMWRAGPLSRDMREVLALYLPVALGLFVSMVGIAIDSNLASRTGEGNLAAMRFATTLVQFPLGLVAFAVSTAVLPILSRQAAAPAFVATLGLGLRLVLLAILPAVAGLVALRGAIVQLLFERGAFGAFDTERTALALLAYAPGIAAA
ncbi:MAG: murein biosynthesis integral membrane protein MurJ, partial [Chloroflexi bacterium]|nr:murein biosynthesis integral membrane protein MurJ [Chloroflexota bacterium]